MNAGGHHVRVRSAGPADSSDEAVLGWLLKGDPSIRWQALQDLAGADGAGRRAGATAGREPGLGCAAARGAGPRRPLGRRAVQPEMDLHHLHPAAVAVARIAVRESAGARRLPAGVGRSAVPRRRSHPVAVDRETGSLHHRDAGAAGVRLRVSRRAPRACRRLAAGPAVAGRRLELPVGARRLAARVVPHVDQRAGGAARVRECRRRAAGRRRHAPRSEPSSSITGCTDRTAPARR